MEQIAFRMQLNPGQLAEYRKRHDEIWPELIALLKESGISDYSIFFHEESGGLFAVLKRSAAHSMDTLAQQAIMQRWWNHMADIMVTGANDEPVVEPMERVFHLA
ncbi:MAG: L-rhamnose mutarotase [Granulosicoccus sp.]|nr:L-rhamnose mutarotase [Granulosicoccus sp.]